MRYLLLLCCCLLFLPSLAHAGDCVDDFDNGNAAGWDEVVGDWEVQDGAYVQLGAGMNTIGVPRTIIQSPWEFTDGTIEVTITFDKRSDGTEIPAILYRLIDDRNGYAFRLHSDSMEVGKFIEGEYSDIRGDAQRIDIGRPCKIRLEVAGVFTKVYYNDVIKARIGDPEPSKESGKGLIGLAVFDASKPIYFDDVKISGQGITPFAPLSHAVKPDGKLASFWGNIKMQ